MEAKIIKRQISYDGTEKFLLCMEDGNLVETVLMRAAYGNSVCVSSQAGCNMGCVFCASGLRKKVRNLTAEEMLAQVETAADFLRAPDYKDQDSESRCEFLTSCSENVSECSFDDQNSHITHVVIMGTGEPFDNYDEVIRFCDIVTSEKDLKKLESPLAAAPIAPRHITVSTCGLVPEILKFTETAKRYNLAISLHASNNEIRNRIMPINRKHPIEELIKAVDSYCSKTKRRVTFEYILLDGINDSDENAFELAGLLKTTNAYVNLIPYNNVAEFSMHGSSKERALQFYDILMKNGIKVTLRKERGSDILAACGQLKSRYENERSAECL